MIETHFTKEALETTRLANDWLVMIQRHQSVAKTQYYFPFVILLFSALAFTLYYAFSLDEIYYYFGILLWIAALLRWILRKKNRRTFWNDIVKLPLKEQLEQVRPLIVGPHWTDYLLQFFMTWAILAFIPMPTIQMQTLNQLLFGLVGAILAVAITYYQERATWKKESSLVEEMAQTIL